MNKSVLITGGAKRIGKAVASHLHEDGWDIILHFRSSVDSALEIQKDFNAKRDNSCEIFQANLDEDEQVEKLCNYILANHQELAAIINNASTFYPVEIEKNTLEDWNNLISSNLKAPIFISKYLCSLLKKNKGSIVNLTDIHAEQGLARYSIYSAAKAGLINLTKTLAKELAPEVLVNSVAPGVILWDENNVPSAEVQKKILNQIPLRKMGCVNDIVMIIDYLLNDNSYMTGRNINIDGGKSLG